MTSENKANKTWDSVKAEYLRQVGEKPTKERRD